MSFKEFMESQGKTTEWLRILMTAIVIAGTSAATFTSYQARQSFLELSKAVAESKQMAQTQAVRTEARMESYDQRITQMEANRFARSEGEALSLRISDNVKSIAVIQTDLAYIKNATANVETKLDRLLERSRP